MKQNRIGQLAFRTKNNELVPYRSPRNKQELQQWFELLFDMVIPDKAVCPEHSAPLDALAASYFVEAPVVVWKASRGFGGKTTMLAGLSMLELMDGANVNILGGSGRQSQMVHDIERETWNRTIILDDIRIESPLKQFIKIEPTTWYTQSIRGNKLIALTASTKSARGPHPQRLRIDEVDEMSEIIFDAAMGQAMSKYGIKAQTTISSTQQYPDGTMAKVLKMAKEKGWIVYEWCYHETSIHNQGWLDDNEIEDKRKSVTNLMWQIEYELQEPLAEGRILSAESLVKTFKPQIGRVHDRMGAYYEFESPKKDGLYATGADWARDVDFTVISTLRYDITPARLVAYERVQFEPYPIMIQRFKHRLKRYPGRGIHDASGVGSVVSDYIDIPDVVDYNVKRKPELYSDYIIAIESGKIECPMVDTIHAEHKYCLYSDIYQSTHPPDIVCSMALAWKAIVKPLAKKRPGRLGRIREI